VLATSGVNPVAPPLSAPPLVSGERGASAEPAVSDAPLAVSAAEPAAPPEPDAPISVNGSTEAIARAIANSKRGAVQQCFERELKRAPQLTGKVLVELELAPPQQVTKLLVRDDLDRPQFTRCVTQAMQHLSFVGLEEEVSIEIPYLLSPLGK
jgi:hypothetical protein